MNKAIPLDEQIVATLTGLCTSEQAAAVLNDAKAVMIDLEQRSEAADVASLSPLATTEQARKKRSEGRELRFEADRMEASVSALEARVADLKDAEAAARREAARLDAAKVRDALAADIARDYPEIVGKLTSLAKRIIACDVLCKRNGLTESAEALGRGVPGNFYTVAGPIIRIPDLNIDMPGGRAAWSRNDYTGNEAWPGLDLLPKEEAA